MPVFALQRVAAASLIAFAVTLPLLAEEDGAATQTRHVIDVNRGEKFATARIRMKATELRELVYRLLDEDGFRVVRYTGSIPDTGETLKAKKHLRHVECELLPDRDPQVTTLSFEYTRFGNRPWSERALNMVVAEVSKHDPPAVPARKRADDPPPPAPEPEVPAADALKKAAIPSVNYFDPSYENDKYETSMPIPLLSIQPLAPPVAPEDNATAPKPAAPTDAAAIPKGMTAEVVTLPGQKNARVANPGEELFRTIQRGDVTPGIGEEKVKVFLEVYWLDANHPPGETPRKTLAHKLAQALSQRQFGSRVAGDVVNLIDSAVRPSELLPQARRALLEKLGTLLDEADVEEKDRAMWTEEVESLLN
jgi:hypothetical protein